MANCPSCIMRIKEGSPNRRTRKDDFVETHVVVGLISLSPKVFVRDYCFGKPVALSPYI